MDFKRIQIVLIISFLLFDIYLIFMLFARINTISTYNDSARNLTIEQELSARNISYPTLKSDSQEVPYVVASKNNYLAANIGQLSNQNASVDGEGTLTSTFDEPVKLNLNLNDKTTGLSEEDRTLLTNNYLSDPEMFIGGQYYRNFWYVNSQRTIYIRMTAYDGNPITDGTAEIQINLDENYNMVGYIQTFQADITALKQKSRMITEREAIEVIDRRAETLIPDGSQIHYSVFTYYRSQELDKFNVYSPAWQVVYDNQNGRYTITVDAIRGTVIQRRQIS